MAHAHIYQPSGSNYICVCGQRAVYDPATKTWKMIK